MNKTIDQTIQRTQRYWYSDGLNEIFTGITIALIGLFDLALLKAPESLTAWAVGLGQPVILVSAWLLGSKVVRSLKERITYPRTGFVAYPKKPRGVLLRAAMVGMATAAAVVLVQWFLGAREQLLPVLLGTLIGLATALLGYRMGVARFYVLGAFSLILGVLIYRRGLTDLAMSAFFFCGLGLGWVISGAAALIRYLRTTNPSEAQQS